MPNLISKIKNLTIITKAIIVLIIILILVVLIGYYYKWQAVGVIVNTCFAYGVLWLSYISSKEAISLFGGIKNINGAFIHEQNTFCFCLTNTGLTPQKIYRMENDKKDILFSFFGNQEQSFSIDFNKDLKSTVVKPYKPNNSRHKDIEIPSPLVLQPSQTIVIPLDKYPSNKSTLDVLNKLSNIEAVFLIDDLGNKKEMLSQGKLKEVLAEYKNFLSKG